MNNIRPLLKRVCAYAIDLFIILVISSLISSIPVFNKEMKKYQNTYEEYEEKYYEYTDYLTLLEESYEDSKITEEEYAKLIGVELYKEKILSRYDDNKISKKEYSTIVTEINNDFDKIAKDYVYLLGKQSVSNSVITLVCTLLYFGVIQYFLKGQTIGKKLLKLQVVSATEKKLNIFTYILRSLIVNEVLLNGIGIIFILTVSKDIYTTADNVIKILISVIEAAIIFLVLTREDQRGLHDLLFGTKVISTEVTIEEKKAEKKVIEAEVIEKTEKEPQKKNVKTTNKKNSKKSEK